MGCCLSSTANDKSSASDPPKCQHFQRSDESRAPPPVDEETVKEVLSETPRPKLVEPVFEEKLERIEEPKRAQEPVFEEKLKLEEVEQWEKSIPICSNGGGEISEASEICSLSESVSATTVTRDEDEEVYQRVNNNRGSPMKLPNNQRDGFGPRREHRVVGKSPTRRTESSPGRRYGPNGGSIGSVRSGQQHPQPMGSRRGGPRAESNRRDPGESSGRRSRSPATRITDGGGVNRSNVGRSPSARRSGRYPGRTPVGPVESSTRRIAEEPKMEEGKWPAHESLDNPLVSLECFIFL
ncbi:hypothetical protein M0R45_013156 [Rubus argutus]|uniref:Uncharacterized protein n=1 Tax=Rubus argutus TaxID=59490 RepID=A0AAW1XHB9_RUBAR